jgi:hypothetical protein
MAWKRDSEDAAAAPVADVCDIIGTYQVVQRMV